MSNEDRLEKLKKIGLLDEETCVRSTDLLNGLEKEFDKRADNIEVLINEFRLNFN